MKRTHLLCGIDSFPFEELRNKRFALMANHTSVNKSGTNILSVLLQHHVRPTIIYSLEHGFFPVAQDMEAVSETPNLRGIPVVSLYGTGEHSLRPPTDSLELFDILLYDVQDIGSRYYTYLSSLMMMMPFLEERKKELIMLDRPNPIGGFVEGTPLQTHYRSFVGIAATPQRHGMTSGEIARYYYDDQHFTFSLFVEKLTGWNRNTYLDEYDYPWVPTSPNMPTVDTAVLYPGACLVEGTTLSEGRGTTQPFHLIGAPHYDPFELADQLTALSIPAVRFLPIRFRPAFQKHAATVCGGVYISVSDRHRFRPLRTFFAILTEMRKQHKTESFLREKSYEFVDKIPAIELLLGDIELINLFYQGGTYQEIDALLTNTEQLFEEHRSPFLLYR